MKHSAALLLFLMLPFLEAFAHHTEGKGRLDSLMAELPNAGEDTFAIKLFNDVSFAVYPADPEAGTRYALKALALSQKLAWPEGEAAAYNNLGNSYRQKASYPQALECYYRALRQYETLGYNDQSSTMEGNIGTVYFYQQAYPKALEHFFRALKTARTTGNRHLEMTIEGNIGNVYYAQGRYGEALTALQQALDIARSLGDRQGTLNQLGNIGNVYASQGAKEAALKTYFEALGLAREAGDAQAIAANEGNIGETYLDLAKDSAIPPAARARHLSDAISYIQQGIAAARAAAFNSAVLDFAQALSEAYALQGNYRAALEAYHHYTALKDSTFSIENNEKIAHLETARALQLKDKDIQIAQLGVAKKRNERYAYIGGIILLLIIMGILFRGFRRGQHSNALISKEKQRSDALLLNILPAEVAEELKDHGSSPARQYDEVSVLFTDFVNFTGTAQKLSPQSLVQELHECFTAFDEIIGRHGLEKIKTIGDAYMAVCGMPQPDAEHAQHAVDAGIEIRDYVARRLTAPQTGNAAFEIRIGINSGPVVAGIVGVKKFAYDIWGDTVNTAARMEQGGEPGHINVSRSTYELVKEDYHCHYRGKIAAKNKGEVEMYFVEPRATRME